MHPILSRIAFLAGGPISIVLSLWSRGTLATVRLEVTGPGLEGPAIFVHWHAYLPLVMPLLGRRRAWLLTSGAPHMEAIARWAERSAADSRRLGRERKGCICGARAGAA
jgi:hypothetical protein